MTTTGLHRHVLPELAEPPRVRAARPYVVPALPDEAALRPPPRYDPVCVAVWTTSIGFLGAFWGAVSMLVA